MVYVDNMQARLGRMVMCHMIADTTEELLMMAAKIGVNEKWIQNAGTNREHFDVCMTAKAKAIQCGAKQITKQELATMTANRKLYNVNN
jgi:hypothetical protein